MGIPVNDVQAVMGHERASTTLNFYTPPPAATIGSGGPLLTIR